jgi:hypothetical protein
LDKYFGTSGLQSKFAQLFRYKIIELQKKVALIRAYKSQDVQRIVTANHDLFGSLDEHLVKQS